VPDVVPLPKTPPPDKPLLKDDESIISLKNMQQLITYIDSLDPELMKDKLKLAEDLMENLKSVQRSL